MLDTALRQLIDRHSAPVPRYTSYPTAPHFHGGVDADTYGGWLRDVRPDATLSLYLHIPYCDRLCWFCGCHTRHTLRYEPITRYLEALFNEIDWVVGHLEGRGRVTAIHLGGGSPTLLSPADFARLKKKLATVFTLAPAAEISIEIDPNDLDEDRFDAMAEFGLTRASVGVQDFEPRVQQAINRPQTFEQTRHVIDSVRARGVGSVNIDALYGLPHQTLQTLTRTMEQVLKLAPDRVALFGYAHVPWMKKPQQMIDAAALPDRYERFAQSTHAAAILTVAGMQPIGLDHFARPTDALARAATARGLVRNFQGYTTDAADVLIGLGASAIGKLPQGYIQNITATGEYEKATQDGGATAKGIALNADDRARAHAIEQLMCRFAVSKSDLAGFGPSGLAVFELARGIAASDCDDLVALVGDKMVVTGRGRPFIRSIAARFDAYLGAGAARHSIAV
jgi:oxygen-independent coproporphyrinogen III oxidase